jgi:transcriptional regulator of acetoin/glycerol metabolism
LPPLRERKEDIYALCRALLARHGSPGLGLTFPFMTGLLHYDFPFNIRELEAFIKRGIALSDGGALDGQHLPDEIKELMKAYGRPPERAAAAAAHRGDQGSARLPAPTEKDASAAEAPGLPLGRVDEHAAAQAPRAVKSAPTEEELRALLARHQGNVAAVGRELGKERMQIHRWMKRFGISADEYR